METIDLRESRIRQRLCIAHGVDRELDELRRLYDGLEEILVRNW